MKALTSIETDRQYYWTGIGKKSGLESLSDFAFEDDVDKSKTIPKEQNPVIKEIPKPQDIKKETPKIELKQDKINVKFSKENQNIEDIVNEKYSVENRTNEQGLARIVQVNKGKNSKFLFVSDGKWTLWDGDTVNKNGVKVPYVKSRKIYWNPSKGKWFTKQGKEFKGK